MEHLGNNIQNQKTFSFDHTELHRAVIRRDLEFIQTKLSDSRNHKKEERIPQLSIYDDQGFTILTLAAKISYTDFKSMEPIINYLLEYEKSAVMIKDGRGMTIIDEAVYAKNNDLIDLLFIFLQNEYFSKLNKRLQLLSQLLISQPDFSFEFHWEVDSTIIPFVSALLPSDTLKILKYKNNVRIDMSNLKFKTQKQNDNPLKKDFTYFITEGDAGSEEKIKIGLLDWHKMLYFNLVEHLIMDEKILFIRRLFAHWRFLTNYIQDVETEVDPTFNIFGNQKNVKIDDFYAYEFAYINNLIINPNLAAQFDNQEYERYAKMTIEEYNQIQDNTQIREAQPIVKKFQTHVWLAQDFPIQFSVIVNLFETLLLILPDSVTSQVLNVIRNQKMLLKLCENNYFPLQFKVPLFYSLYVKAQIINFKPLDKLNNEETEEIEKLFHIPKSLGHSSRRDMLCRLEESGFKGKVFEKFKYLFQQQKL